LDPARTFFIIVDMDDNPHLDEDQKKEALAGYSNDELKARKEGGYIHLAGMIYTEFKQTEHVIPEAPMPKECYVYVAIDPGIRNLAGVLWGYCDHTGVLTIFDEFAEQGYTVEDVARQINLINKKHGISDPGHYVIDPAARNIMHQTGRSDQ